ncbi:hypothetical protein D3C84_977300 [compost metagenome]
MAPPIKTPKKEDIEMVTVAIGPAIDMSKCKVSVNKVGNQFLAAQPGKLGAEK